MLEFFAKINNYSLIQIIIIQYYIKLRKPSNTYLIQYQTESNITIAQLVRSFTWNVGSIGFESRCCHYFGFECSLFYLILNIRD